MIPDRTQTDCLQSHSWLVLGPSQAQSVSLCFWQYLLCPQDPIDHIGQVVAIIGEEMDGLYALGGEDPRGFLGAVTALAVVAVYQQDRQLGDAVLGQ